MKSGIIAAAVTLQNYVTIGKQHSRFKKFKIDFKSVRTLQLAQQPIENQHHGQSCQARGIAEQQ